MDRKTNELKPIRGFNDYYILLYLYLIKESYPYALRADANTRSKGKYVPTESTIYTAFNRLKANNQIESFEKNSNFCKITNEGKNLLIQLYDKFSKRENLVWKKLIDSIFPELDLQKDKFEDLINTVKENAKIQKTNEDSKQKSETLPNNDESINEVEQKKNSNDFENENSNINITFSINEEETSKSENLSNNSNSNVNINKFAVDYYDNEEKNSFKRIQDSIYEGVQEYKANNINSDAIDEKKDTIDSKNDNNNKTAIIPSDLSKANSDCFEEFDKENFKDNLLNNLKNDNNEVKQKSGYVNASYESIKDFQNSIEDNQLKENNKNDEIVSVITYFEDIIEKENNSNLDDKISTNLNSSKINGAIDSVSSNISTTKEEKETFTQSENQDKNQNIVTNYQTDNTSTNSENNLNQSTLTQNEVTYAGNDFNKNLKVYKESDVTNELENQPNHEQFNNNLKDCNNDIIEENNAKKQKEFKLPIKKYNQDYKINTLTNYYNANYTNMYVSLVFLSLIIVIQSVFYLINPKIEIYIYYFLSLGIGILQYLIFLGKFLIHKNLKRKISDNLLNNLGITLIVSLLLILIFVFINFLQTKNLKFVFTIKNYVVLASIMAINTIPFINLFMINTLTKKENKK